MPNSRPLWPRVAERSEAALRSGALLPIPTATELVTDGEVTFLVRLVRGAWPSAAPGRNPFLPPEPELVVSELGPSHRAVLNRFSVLPDHLLIVTREFEEQESQLTLEDFRAAWICLWQKDTLVFYNSGPVAGASQRHKHLQAVPLPLASTGPRVPLDPLLDRVVFDGQVSRAPRLPFVNGFAKLDPGWVEDEGARGSYDLYRQMAEALNLVGTGAAEARPLPHNVLLTREWLLIVPRSQESFETISINALGFAGAFLVKTEAERQRLREFGPLKALGRVAVSRGA
jgi:sulfate adenylyltransferase (ADP) / ATP adenylyltransferase